MSRSAKMDGTNTQTVEYVCTYLIVGAAGYPAKVHGRFADLSDFRVAVKATFSRHLQYVEAYELVVYPNDAARTSDVRLRESTSSDQYGRDPDSPVVVVAPSPVPGTGETVAAMFIHRAFWIPALLVVSPLFCFANLQLSRKQTLLFRQVCIVSFGVHVDLCRLERARALPD